MIVDEGVQRQDQARASFISSSSLARVTLLSLHNSQHQFYSLLMLTISKYLQPPLLSPTIRAYGTVASVAGSYLSLRCSQLFSSFSLRRLRFSPYWPLFLLSLCLLIFSHLNYHTISKSPLFQRHDGDFFLRQWSSNSLYSFNRKILTSSNKSTSMASIHAGSYQWSLLAYWFVAVKDEF